MDDSQFSKEEQNIDPVSEFNNMFRQMCVIYHPDLSCFSVEKNNLKCTNSRDSLRLFADKYLFKRRVTVVLFFLIYT